MDGQTSLNSKQRRAFYPEIYPKITPAMIKKADKKGKGVDLRPMVTWLKLLGTFKGDKNIREISRRLYETKLIPAVGNQEEQIDDQSAYLRFDNVISGNRSIMREEIEFFRMSIAYHVGDNLAQSITDDQIREGKALAMFRDLFMQAPALHWDNIDPLFAILELASSRYELRDTFFGEPKTKRAGDGSSPEILKVINEDVELEPGYRFYLDTYVPKNYLQYQPLVLEFGYQTVLTKGGRELRATHYPHTKKIKLSEVANAREIAEPDLWRTYMKPNESFNVTSEKGRFGFLIIAHAGNNIEQWLPKGANSECINNEDLKYMYMKLAQCADMEDNISYGLLNYRVS